MNTSDTNFEPLPARAGSVSDGPQPIRCGTLLCGNLAEWRRPKTWGGHETGEWHRKCQRCFDNARENPELWSRVLQPSQNDQMQTTPESKP
jgi:hypothetical protein